MPNETRVLITSALDIVTARQQGRSLAMELGFEGAEVTLVAAAISEVARNIVEYAKSGEILFQTVKNGGKQARGICTWSNHSATVSCWRRWMGWVMERKRPPLRRPLWPCWKVMLKNR